MSSLLKTNSISAATGSTVSIPSGTTLDIASGATITNSGTATGFGKVLQVVQAVKTDTVTTTSTSFVDVSGLSVSITPASTSNKVLVFVTLGGTANSTNTVLLNLVRDSTALAQPDSGSNPASMNNFPGGSSSHMGGSLIVLDTPSTTSSTTYKIQFRVDSGTGFLNRHTGNTNYNSVSTITAMEIEG